MHEKILSKMHDLLMDDACKLFEKQQGYNPKNRRGLKKETIDLYNDCGSIIYAFNYSEIQYLEYPYGVQLLIPEKELKELMAIAEITENDIFCDFCANIIRAKRKRYEVAVEYPFYISSEGIICNNDEYNYCMDIEWNYCPKCGIKLEYSL